MGHQQGLSPGWPASGRMPAFPRGKGMYWRLSATLTACVASDRILFLDVGRDRYFALPPLENEAILAWLSGPSQGALPDHCRTILSDLGIMDAKTAQELVATPCEVAKPEPLDSTPLPRSPIRLSVLCGVALTVWSAWRDVRSRQLATVLARRLPKRQCVDPADVDLQSKLADFRSMRPLIPVPRVCLHDCLALMDWLGPARDRAELVFGVSAYPFAAHSWVQADGQVIDDHPESASRFEPILRLP